MFLLAKYGVSQTIEFPLIKRGQVDFAVSADWTPAAGDVKIIKDGGAAASTTNLPSAVTSGNGAVWQLTLTATEMQAARIVITIVDAATKAIEDQALLIITFGNASAQLVTDFSVAALDQAGVRTAVGLATANLDTQLGAIAGYVDTEIGTIVTQTSAASIRAAVGLAAANLDTQLGAIAGYIDTEVGTIVTQTSAAAIRAAVGLATANLDTQLGAIAGYIDTEVGTIVTQTSAAAIRAAVGLATANLDTQLGAIAGYIDTEVGTIVTQTSAAAIRAAVGLATANLDTQLGAIAGYIDTEVAAIKAKTDNLPANPAAQSDCITTAGVRAAVGLAAANLDTMLGAIAGYIDTEVGTIVTQTSAASIRAAVGLATANLDTQLAGLSGGGGGGGGGGVTLTQLQTELAIFKGAGFSQGTDTLEKISDAVSALTPSSGTGAFTLAITVHDQNGQPLEGATVRVTEGVTSLVRTTGADGTFSPPFSVDQKTYAVVITKPGYDFSPTTVTITANRTITYTLTPVAITPDPDPAKTRVVMTTYDERGVLRANVNVTFQLIRVPTGDVNHVLSITRFTVASNVDGVIDVSLWTGAQYEATREDSPFKIRFTPTGSVFDIPSFVGPSA